MKNAVALALTLALGACSASAVAPPETGRITIDNLIDIKHPSNPMWSPDGKRVAFVWDRAGIQNFYLADAASTTPAPKALTSYENGALGNAFWGKDSDRLYFSRDGDLWQISAGGGAPQAVWTTPMSESSITPSPDVSRVAFVQAGCGIAPREGQRLVDPRPDGGPRVTNRARRCGHWGGDVGARWRAPDLCGWRAIDST